MGTGVRKYVKAILNLLTAVALLLLAVLLLPWLLRFFMPFVIGWIIAMIANPLVHLFEQKIKIRRKAGSAIVIIAVLAGVILLGYFLVARLVTEGAAFLSDLPELWEDVEGVLDTVMQNLSDVYARFPLTIQENITRITENMGETISSVINELSAPTVTAVGNIAKNIPSVIVSVIMCLLSSYFFVAERERIDAFLRRHLPEGEMHIAP